MRLELFLVCAASMAVSAHSVRLHDCSQAYCVAQTVPLGNFTAQGASEWEERPLLGVAINAFAENVATWFARFLPAQELTVPAVAVEEPVTAKKPQHLSGDLSFASFVRGLRGLNSYEYAPVEVQPIAAEELVIAPQQ